MRKFMLAALPYIIVILIGATAGSYKWWKVYFEPSPENVFFDNLPEFESLEFLPNVKSENDQAILALFYSDITATCGRAKVLRELIGNCSNNLKVILVLDSSFQAHDIENARTVGGFNCVLFALSESESKKWFDLARKVFSDKEGSKEAHFDGVGILEINNKKRRVFINETDSMLEVLRLVQ